jgi:hypothetical protein
MNKLMRRTLMAYRPLYLNGLLLDGRHRLPVAREPDDPAPDHTRRPVRRGLLVALTGLGHQLFSHRSTSC